MEFFEHRDLHYCVFTALTEEEACDITFQVNEALGFMHSNDYMHRDIKPSVRKPPRHSRMSLTVPRRTFLWCRSPQAGG